MSKKRTISPVGGLIVRLCPVLLTGLAALPLTAANVDTYWKSTPGAGGADGSWTDAAHWTNGVPTDLSSANDTNRAFFDTTSGAVSNVTLGDGLSAIFNQLQIQTGKTLNLSLGSNTTFSNGSLAINSLGAATAFRIDGPASGTATVNLGTFVNIGGNASGTNASLTLSGSGINANATGTVTVGRAGNDQAMTVENGASFQGTALVVSGTQNVTSGVGNNNIFTVRGAGSNVTLNGGGTLALIVGSRPLTGSSGSNVQTGNRVLVEQGGKLTVVGNSGSISEVLVGAANYRTNNSIEVSGANSVFEVSGDSLTRIGHANDSSYNNRITVGSGGVFRTDREIEIRNGVSTAVSRRNILSIDNGGKLVTSSTVENNGGLVRLASGGQIVAETLAGVQATATVNINGTGRFEAAGLIGQGVTVNIGDGGAATFGFGSANGYTDVGTVDLQGNVNFNGGSSASFMIKSATEVDQINIGAGGVVNIDPTASLRIFSTYAFSVGDSFQLFIGNLDGINGSFSSDLITIPTLGGGLEWDLSQFTADYGYTLTVVPEPSLVALGLGAGALAFVALRRRQRKCA